MSLKNFSFISKIVAAIIRFCLDIFILIAAIFVTFTYLLLRVKNILHDNAIQGREQYRPPSVWFKLKVPMLMSITFIMFNVSGTIWYFLDHEVAEYENPVYEVLEIFVWCSDTLIYIFVQKKVRCLLTLYCCGRVSENRVAGM